MRVLLLQGPFGPFFRKYAERLEAKGFEVHKINFNGGDAAYFRHPNAVSYRGTLEDWPAYLTEFVRRHRISRIYVFGYWRVYHQAAARVAQKLNVKLHAFDEGYVRPSYVTLDTGGTHSRSSLPRDPNFYRRVRPVADTPRRIGGSLWHAAMYGATYYIAAAFTSWRYPHYRHHRAFSPLREGTFWIVKGILHTVRKLWDRSRQAQLITRHARNFFLVPLQVRNDAAIVHNSRYLTIEDFIVETLGSFARHAPRRMLLVFKQHPLDVRLGSYWPLIRREARRLGVLDRMRYLHDADLPSLIRASRGAVLINSTVGMSCLHHGRPVKTLGDAIYDMPGLTTQLPLARFWRTPQPVDSELYRRFRSYLVQTTQINCSFYKGAVPDVVHGIPALTSQHVIGSYAADPALGYPVRAE